MTLTNLIKSRNLISEVDDSKFIEEYEKYVKSLAKILLTCDADYSEYIEQLNKNLVDIKNIIDNTKSTIQAVNDKVDAGVEEKTKGWNKVGYTTDNGMQLTTAMTCELERGNRNYIISDSTKQKVLALIQNLTTPRYPGLEIGPGDGVWTPLLVAADPLYLVDVHPEFLESTLSKFPEQYQRRVRPYLLEFDNCFNLDVLPQNQIGFIFSWNVFDYFPITETRLYLESCFKVLRPGGAMVFSYNNCDHVLGTNLAEIGNKSWMTEDMLLSTCKELGFEIDRSDSGPEAWICIKKPGDLNTVKTHQALGEIVNQNP